MGNARYIGRVGALAVALGVGAAIASAPATAWADDSDTSTSSTASTASDASQTTKKTAGTKKSDTSGSPSESASDSGESEAGDSDEDAGDDESVEEPDASEDTDEIDTGSTTDESAEPVVEEEDSVTEETDESTELPADEAETDVADQEPVSTGAEEAPAEVSDTAVPEQQADEVTPKATTGWASLASPNPASPAGSPILDALLAWIRRTFVAPLYNRPPTARPVVIGEDADGDVLGTIGAFDPDGEKLFYRLVNGPKYGTVTLNADGTFRYTAFAGLAQNGGDDTFTIEVRDAGLRLFSRNAVVSVPIEVTVGAGDILGIGGTPFAVAMSPDGRSAYVTDVTNNRVSVIDIATRAVVDSIEVGEAPYGIVIAGDGRGYVVNSDDSTITVIDTETNTVLGVPLYVGNSPTSVTVNAGGTRVYVTNSNDDSISVIDTETFAVTRVVVGDGAFGVAVDGDRVYVTNEFDDTITVIDADTNQVINVVNVGNAPTGIAVGGGRIVVTNSGSSAIGGDGTVTIIDAATLTVIGNPIVIGETPSAVVIDAEGTRAYITDLGADTVTVLDLTTGSIIGEPISVAPGATGIAIGFDGRLYVAGSDEGVIAPVTLDTPAVGTFSPVVPSAAKVSTAAALAAAAGPGPNRSQFTIGFNVYNLTRDKLTLTGFDGDARPDGNTPFVGYTIEPGGFLHFEVGASYFGNTVGAIFTNSKGEQWTAKMTAEFITAFGIPTGTRGESKMDHSGGTGTGIPSPTSFWGRLGGTDISILEAPGTTVTMGPELGKARTDLMNSLCNGGQASCLLKIKDEAVKAYSAPHPPRVAPGSSSVLDNTGGAIAQSSTVKYTETESTKLSIEGSTKFSIGVKDSWGAEISSKIGKEWASTKSWEETKPLIAPPFTKVELLVRTPVWRMTGDVVIQIGNTTITMNNITIEAPNYGDPDYPFETVYRYTPPGNAPKPVV